MTYRDVKIPKRNGRPQLWTRGASHHTGLRIIMPDGGVDWSASPDSDSWGDYPTYPKSMLVVCPLSGAPETPERFSQYACTEARTQLQAIKNCIDYDLSYGAKDLPVFLGYL